MNQAQQNTAVQSFEKSMKNVHALYNIGGSSDQLSDESNNAQQQSNIMDGNNPIFSGYPAMKLGCMAEVNRYGEQLAELAARQMTLYCAQYHTANDAPISTQNSHSNEALTGDWVVIAPPYFQLPSAANLLAQVVAERLHVRFPTVLDAHPFSITLVQPRLHAQSTRFSTQAEFDLYYNYSKNNSSQRMAERQRVQQSLQTEQLSAQLQGKQLVVINDINVTGTQQHFMQQTFNTAGATICLWLYIFNLDAELAANHPEIEYHINNLNLATPETFAQTLRREDVCHTVRCLSRLFNENETTFGHILHLLQPWHCQQLVQLAERETRYSSDLFVDKMALLKRCAREKSLM